MSTMCLYGLSSLVVLVVTLPWMETIILNGRCGSPGKPYRSKTEVDVKAHYDEGDEVAYQCHDYRNYRQVRQCVRGRWMGPPARCADALRHVWLRHVRIEDVSDSFHPPRLVQSVRNLNLTLGEWRFPNAYTNSRSPEVTFLLHSDRVYRWHLVFNDTFNKPFMHINFNVHNFTHLSAATKARMFLNVSLDVGRFRTCYFVAQTFDIWKSSGRKTESFFECDSNSPGDYAADSPTNQMVMFTQSSLNVTYELLAILPGVSYGTQTEPICGEPEHAISHEVHFNQEYRDYSFICKQGFEYENVVDKTKLSGTSVHFQRCGGDMFWEGKYPVCVPRVHCSIDALRYDPSSPGRLDESIEIYQLQNVYFVNETSFYAIEGTVAVYACANSTQALLLGKETRVCNKNGTWSAAKPTCQDPNKTNYTIMGIALLIFVVIIIIFLLITRRFKQRIMKSIETQQASTLAVKEMMALYDDPEYDLARDDTYANYAYELNEYGKLDEAVSGTPESEHPNRTRNDYQQPAPPDDSYIAWNKAAAATAPQQDLYVVQQTQSFPPSTSQSPSSFDHFKPMSNARQAKPDQVEYLEMAIESMPATHKAAIHLSGTHAHVNPTVRVVTRPEPMQRGLRGASKKTHRDDDTIYANYQ